MNYCLLSMLQCRLRMLKSKMPDESGIAFWQPENFPGKALGMSIEEQKSLP